MSDEEANYYEVEIPQAAIPPTWVDLADPKSGYHNLIRISDIQGIEYDKGRKFLLIKAEQFKTWLYGGFGYDETASGFPPFVRTVLKTIGALHLLTSLKWAEEKAGE